MALYAYMKIARMPKAVCPIKHHTSKPIPDAPLSAGAPGWPAVCADRHLLPVGVRHCAGWQQGQGGAHFHEFWRCHCHCGAGRPAGGGIPGGLLGWSSGGYNTYILTATQNRPIVLLSASEIDQSCRSSLPRIGAHVHKYLIQKHVPFNMRRMHNPMPAQNGFRHILSSTCRAGAL